jgi:hypothetical protein
MGAIDRPLTVPLSTVPSTKEIKSFEANSTNGASKCPSTAPRIAGQSPHLPREKQRFIDEIDFQKNFKSEWMRPLKSRQFWFALAGAFFLAGVLAAILPLYFPSRGNASPPAFQISQDSTAHSFIIDVVTADDEDTRATVLESETRLTIEPTKRSFGHRHRRYSVCHSSGSVITDIQRIQINC